MIEIDNNPQGTDGWLQARCGRVTASRFSDVMAKGEGKVRDEYLRQVAGEVLTEEPMQTYKNAAMEHGNEVEQEARDLYAMLFNQQVQQVGFISAGRVGCSPDGLIGDDGMVEIKRQAPHLLIQRIRDGVGSKHLPQVQGNLWVTGRKWIDLCCYYPKMPMYRQRIERDEAYIAKIESAVNDFIRDIDALVEQVRKYKA
jgi:hypothetical protein